MNDLIAIKEDDLNAMISNITANNEEIIKSFNDLSVIMSDISGSIEGEVADSINAKFSEFETQFPIIKEDMSSYIEDFKKLCISFNSKDSAVSVDEIQNDEGGEFINVNN